MCEAAQEIQDIYQNRPTEAGDYVKTKSDYYEIYDKHCDKHRRLLNYIYVCTQSDTLHWCKAESTTIHSEYRIQTSWAKIGLIWMPRQDQLQTICKNVLKPGEIPIVWVTEQAVKLYNPFALTQIANSWTQLWMAIVMKTNYRKTWKDGQWRRMK
jgi:hypothetical protein